MKRWIWLATAGLLLSLITFIFLLPEKNSSHRNNVSPIEKEKVVNIKQQEQQTKKASSPTQKAAEEINPYENEVIKAQVQQAADIYAENIKYPLTSQPIYNPEDVREYEPFEQSEVSLPFPLNNDDKNPIRISAATDTFQYFENDTVIIQVNISNAPKGVAIAVNGVVSGANGDLPSEIQFQSSGQNATQFSANFDTRKAPKKLLTPEMSIKLNVVVGNRDLHTTVAFRYAIASARIVDALPAKPEGAELIIPLELEVFRGGYYFLNGVLEDADSGRPLIQLQSESRLPQGAATMYLKAHIAALKHQASEGPYILRRLQIYKGADVGEDFDAPASSSQSQFNISGFPFSDYSDEEYVDEQAQERLDFLRSLGSVDDSGDQ